MLSTNVDWVDGWEIHYRADGGYGVYDEHGLLAGPFGTKAGAIQAALTLPKRSSTNQTRNTTAHIAPQYHA